MLNWLFSEHYPRRSRPYDRLNSVVFRNLTYGAFRTHSTGEPHGA